MQMLHTSDGATAAFMAVTLTPRSTGLDWFGIFMALLLCWTDAGSSAAFGTLSLPAGDNR